MPPATIKPVRLIWRPVYQTAVRNGEKIREEIRETIREKICEKIRGHCGVALGTPAAPMCGSSVPAFFHFPCVDSFRTQARRPALRDNEISHRSEERRV